jgi:hypothetical protein
MVVVLLKVEGDRIAAARYVVAARPITAARAPRG